jgi:hypothetical protein
MISIDDGLLLRVPNTAPNTTARMIAAMMMATMPRRILFFLYQELNTEEKSIIVE